MIRIKIKIHLSIHTISYPVLDGVPEDDAVLRSLRLVESIDDGVAEMTPLVVGAHISKVHKVINSECQTQTTSLPCTVAKIFARHLCD